MWPKALRLFFLAFLIFNTTPLIAVEPEQTLQQRQERVRWHLQRIEEAEAQVQWVRSELDKVTRIHGLTSFVSTAGAAFLLWLSHFRNTSHYIQKSSFCMQLLEGTGLGVAIGLGIGVGIQAAMDDPVNTNISHMGIDTLLGIGAGTAVGASLWYLVRTGLAIHALASALGISVGATAGALSGSSSYALGNNLFRLEDEMRKALIALGNEREALKSSVEKAPDVETANPERTSFLGTN